jgi:hypothetical protein
MLRPTVVQQSENRCKPVEFCLIRFGQGRSIPIRNPGCLPKNIGRKSGRSITVINLGFLTGNIGGDASPLQIYKYNMLIN